MAIASIYSQCQPCYDALMDDNETGDDFVCGADNITYINECFALCNNTTVEYTEKCYQNQCLDYWYPVCTNRGTYANECEARHFEASI